MSDDLAAALAGAFVGGQLVERLPESALADADAVLALAGAARISVPWLQAGWKIGATSAAAQAIMATDQPFFGPVFEPRLFEDGAVLDVPPGFRGFECEFALRLGADLPARDGGYDVASLRIAVDAVVPVIEIVATRQRLDGMGNARLAQADFGFCHGLVLGTPLAPPPLDDLGAVSVRALVDDVEVGRGTAADVLGHPLHALAWLTAQDLTLRAGHLVSTGTCTGLAKPLSGQVAVADFGSFGRVGFTAG
ncbi:MAG: fumarylacetoacetate hydrolase family protein [Pseudomonadota bacterium]